MSSYLPILAAVAAVLAELAPSREVTRNYRDFADIPDAELVRGVYTVLPIGVAGYPYERSDDGDVDGPRQTDLGRFQFEIVGQIRLSEAATGVEVDEAELGMLEELEQLANAALEDATLVSLFLQSAELSGQLEKPYAWVRTAWEIQPIT